VISKIDIFEIKMLPDCTMVTACYQFKHVHSGALSLEELQQAMTGTLGIPAYMVIFCDQYLAPFVKEFRESRGMGEMTRIHQVEYMDLETYRLLDRVNANRAVFWPTRDARTSGETHLLMYSKFEFVEKTIDENPFSTTKFAWIDSCLKPNLSKICEDYSHSKILRLLHGISDKYHINILNVCEKRFKDPESKREFYSQYRWIMCGGFFTCGAEIGKRVLRRLRQLSVDTTMAGYGHGDEMLYLEIIDEFYDEMDRSYGDYGQIIDNFLQPERNLGYILHCIIKRYSAMGYHRECYDCCAKVIAAQESFTVKEDYYVWVEAYFYYYISAFYYRRSEAREIVERIRLLCKENPYFGEEFAKRREYYESQFVYVM
jgi:hypothetical protein